MKNNQKGFVNLFVALMVVLLIGGGVYMFTQNKQLNQPGVENSNIQATATSSLVSNVS